MMDRNDAIYVADGDTLIGAALLRQLAQGEWRRVHGGAGEEPDLTDSHAVDAFFERVRPSYVFVAAGKSAGISANQAYPADLMLHNLQVATHVIDAAHRFGARKLLYFSSSCVYPKHCAQPMRVEDLFTAPLEPTSESYALAKIAGMKLCDAYRRQYGAAFISGIVADVFGPGDDFRPEHAHVIGALMHRMHLARERREAVVEVWGTGAPRREFLYADDLADAAVFVMQQYDGPAPINLGGGVEVSIRDVAQAIKGIVGFEGELRFDTTKPDGMPRKLLDSGPLRSLGWTPGTPFPRALAETYQWFKANAQRVMNAHA